MILLQDKLLSPLSQCHYLPHEQWRFEYFYAAQLSGDELGILLSEGWRKFGYYYFRPACPNCRKCIPLRVTADTFSPSKSQKRVMNKNKDVHVRFAPLKFSPRIYEIYQIHSSNRFGKEDCASEEFIGSFYTESCPAMQSEYYLDDELIAMGFLDRSSDGLSSVYFIYDTSYGHLGLGTYSAIREIMYTAELGLSHYYLGYYIEECGKMAYKNRFHPHEQYDWEKGEWSLFTCI